MTQEQIMYLIQTINELKNEVSMLKEQLHENTLLTSISSPILSPEQRQSAYTEYMQIQQQKMAKEENHRQFK